MQGCRKLQDAKRLILRAGQIWPGEESWLQMQIGWSIMQSILVRLF